MDFRHQLNDIRKGLDAIDGGGALHLYNLPEAVRDLELAAIDHALEIAGGSENLASQLLMMPRSTLRYRLDKRAERAAEEHQAVLQGDNGR